MTSLGVPVTLLAGAAIAQVPVAAALVPWAVIGCVAGRASQGIVNASSAAPGVQASLRRDLPPLAALAGWAVALRASRALALGCDGEGTQLRHISNAQGRTTRTAHCRAV